MKFSGFFREVREGLKEKQCCWCAGRMWGSREPAARDAQGLAFAALVPAGTHTHRLEISYSLAQTGCQSLYSVRRLMQTFRCTLVGLDLRRKVVDLQRKCCR